MIDWFQTRFEDGLRTFHDGLSTPRTRKTLTPVQQKIGQLQEANAGVAQQYTITVTPDPENKQAEDMNPSDGSMTQKHSQGACRTAISKNPQNPSLSCHRPF
ncbi:MAG: hypothetical protein OXC62_15630 [Aestuariivita sp.]|nr:hypothetical protein [Aestuariivita sp.]